MANTRVFLIFATCIVFLHMVNGQGQNSQQTFQWENTLIGQRQQEVGPGQRFNLQNSGFLNPNEPLGSQGFNPQNSGFPGQSGPLGSQGFNLQNSGFLSSNGPLGSQGFNPQNSGFPSQSGPLGSQGFQGGGPFTSDFQQTNFGQSPYLAYPFIPMNNGFQGFFPQQGSNMLYPWQMGGQFPMSNFQGTFQQGSQFPSNPFSQMGNSGGLPWQLSNPWMLQGNSQGLQGSFGPNQLNFNQQTPNNNFGFNPGFSSNADQGNSVFGVGPNSRDSSNSLSTFRQ